MSVPPRLGLVVTCFAHAAIFGWAASTLPWRSGTTFSVAVLLLAVLHLVTAAAALSRRAAFVRWTFAALSAASALAFLGFTWTVVAAALYVSKLYVRLGPPIAGGLLVVGILLAALTLPIAVWGGRETWRFPARVRKLLATGGLLAVVLATLSLPLAGKAARGEPVAHIDSELLTNISDMLEQQVPNAQAQPRSTVAGAGVAECGSPLAADTPTLFVAYVAEDGKAQSICLQGGTAAAVRIKLRRELRKVKPGSVVVVDLVRSFRLLERTFPLLDAVEVRPGLDGVCEGTLCLPAWQLTLGDSFAANQPLPAIPDATFGFSAEAVRRALGSKRSGQDLGIDGFVRFEADSFVADETGVHRLVRTRPTPAALSSLTASEAVSAAQRYITSAQEKDGSFRYALDPTTGQADEATMNLPRQAGTTYALCELGHGSTVKRTVRRALRAFEATEKNFGAFSALSNDGDYGLGRSALPLLAMLRCRDFAGEANDRLIGQLARLMLTLQRENGSFYPALDGKTRRGSGEHEVLYAAGQAVLSLVLLEQQRESLLGTAAEPLPAADTLKSAIDRAMTFYGGPYWPAPLRDFFFFEEGWHCLAARTALTSHRNDGYERLCIDYVDSRKRFILRQADTSELHFVGGYGTGDLFPPRNTATAGVGEALNAAIAIKQKRGMPVEADKAVLRDLVTFLIRAQWTATSCYACRDPEQVAGGFSQQLASPSIRIDYVQHAMAAIGHGSKILGLM